ncbi:hypothetical protein Tco_1426886, partial [Tanacetum coccineum]
MYSSWASRMLLYIRGKENGKLLVDSVLNGPFKYGTFTVLDTQTTPTTVRERTYDKLTYAEKIHESCEIKAINIVLQGLPQDIYNMVNHHTKDKDIWDRVELLIEGLEISLQDREYKLYDEFDMFTSVPGETIHTKNEAHTDEVRLTRKQFSDPIALGRQNQGYAGSGARSNATATRVTKLGEPTQQVRQRLYAATTVKRKDTWQDSEIPTPAAFQTDDLDALGSDCNEAPSASVVLMAKLSSYDSATLLE